MKSRLSLLVTAASFCALSLVGGAGSVALAQGGPHAQEAKMVLEACKQDIKQFCSQVPPGEGRVKACMKQHLPQLSEPCKEALFQAWLHD